MTRSESIAKLADALSKAQAGIRNAAQDKTNPAFKSKYADLASVWEACRTHLSANGLAVVQTPTAEGSKVTVTTLLMHSSGEWLASDLTVTADKGTAQGIGSAITYARRYGLSSVVGVAPGDDIADEGDDDGNAASGTARQTRKLAQRPQDSTAKKAEALVKQVEQAQAGGVSALDVWKDRIARASDLAELDEVKASIKSAVEADPGAWTDAEREELRDLAKKRWHAIDEARAA